MGLCKFKWSRQFTCFMRPWTTHYNHSDVNHSLGYQKTHSLISIYGTFSVSQALYQVGAGPMEIPKILLSGST